MADGKRTQAEILADLAAFAAPNDDWGKLEEVLQELWRDGRPEWAIGELLSVFSRYPPDEDGCGVFWSIVHGVESLTNYEEVLPKSVDQSPSDFGILMVARQINAGVKAIGGYQLLELVREISARDNLQPELRHAAHRVVTRFEN